MPPALPTDLFLLRYLGLKTQQLRTNSLKNRADRGRVGGFVRAAFSLVSNNNTPSRLKIFKWGG